MAVLLNMRPDEEVEPNLPAYLADLRAVNLLPRTIREKRLTTLRVARALGHPVADATADELRAWQTAEMERTNPRTGKPKRPASIHNDIVHISTYLRWLVQTDRLEVDPSVKGLRRPRKVQRGRGPTPTADADLDRALAAAGQPMHAWLALSAFCGLRCMEIASLRAEDVTGPDRPRLRIVGKGDKERLVTLPRGLYDELVRDFPPTGYLFARLDGKPGPPSAMRVSKRINDHLHALGIKTTAHSGRHWFGTNLFAAGLDPFTVAEQMGHSSVDTTRMYVLLASDTARDAVESMFGRSIAS